jgi:drug/metabolite transporter (DMT)-like permease
MKLSHAMQLLLLSAVWGISFLMIRVAGGSFPPVWVSLLRCGLGAMLLWVILVAGRNALPPRRLWPWLVLVALLNNALPFTFFALGERTVPSNIAAIINATTPIWTLLLAMTVQRSRPTVMTAAGVLLAFAGVMVAVSTHGGSSAEAPDGMLAGVGIIAAAAFGYAVATLVAKAKLRGLDPIGLATTQLSLATLMLLPFALAGEHPRDLAAGPVAAVAVLGFAGSGIAYLLYYRLLAHITATQLAAVTYLLPLWGLLWGSLAHESIGLVTCAGVAMTILGLVLLNLRRAPGAAATAEPTSPRQSSARAAADRGSTESRSPSEPGR